MTTMHGKWSNRVALPVGKQWGTVDGGVAACMTWDTGPKPPPTPLVRVGTPSRRTPNPYYRHEPEVYFDPRSIDQLACGRQNGYFEAGVESVRDSYNHEREAELRRTPSGYRTVTNRPPTPVIVHRETTGAGTPYLEHQVTEVVKDQSNQTQNYTVNERLTYPATVAARPPRAPKPRAKSAAQQRRVECKQTFGRGAPNLKITRPNSAHGYGGRGKTVSFRPGTSSTIGYGGYDYVTPRSLFDDDIIDERDLNAYYYGTSDGAHFRSWRDANKVETPDLRRYLNQPLKRSSSYDNLWKMKKFTQNAKSKVVSHWDDERPWVGHGSRAESPGKVNVQLDCPDDSDMTVNVTVNKSTAKPTPPKTRWVPRPPSKSLAWY